MELFAPSNTNESINGMIYECCCEEGWLGVIDVVLDKMICMISGRRQKYKDHTPDGVVSVVNQILRQNWESAASMQVVEIEENLGAFKISGQIGLQSPNKKKKEEQGDENNGEDDVRRFAGK